MRLRGSLIMNEIEFKILMNNKLCDLAKLFIDYYNPCKIDLGECTNQVACCTHKSKFGYKETGICRFLVGICTFDNVYCRVYLCDKAREVSPECAKYLDMIRGIGEGLGLA